MGLESEMHAEKFTNRLLNLMHASDYVHRPVSRTGDAHFSCYATSSLVRNDVKLLYGGEKMFDCIMNFLGAFEATSSHRYELNLSQGPRKLDEVYWTRSAAESRMYELCGKYDLQIVKVYPDKHFKTYICSNGATFHINRM